MVHKDSARNCAREDVSEGQDDGQSDATGWLRDRACDESRHEGQRDVQSEYRPHAHKGYDNSDTREGTGKQIGMNRTGQLRNSNGQRVGKESSASVRGACAEWGC